MTAIFKPDWACPPGVTISHALAERRLTRDCLASRMGCDARFIESLLDGEAEITSEVAKSLAKNIGSSESFWLSREANYRSSVARLFRSHLRTSPDDWLHSLPIDDMIRFGWLSVRAGEDVRRACLRFFGLSHDHEWPRYESRYVGIAFRASAAFETNPASVASWLRRGEVEASKLLCKTWNRQQFRKLVPALRSFTRQKSPRLFLPRLQAICAEVGVAVVVVRAPAGCRASGAARFLAKDKALIQLSTRYLTDDQFWFSFFHEAGHLLSHKCDQPFIDGIGEKATAQEKQADEFASDVLLPKADLESLRATFLSYKSIIRFAVRSGVGPGVVVGQLQNAGAADRAWFNRAKRKLDWSGVAV